MGLELLQAIGLFVAAFIAGAINAVAGGGSLVSFPALMAVGYEAKAANVTNTVALWPGYLGGSVGYREELRTQRARVIGLLAPSVLGALAGSAVLLATSADSFEAIVPFLILFAAALMAVQPPLSRLVERFHPASAGGGGRSLVLFGGVFLLAVYGAYFGAGLGILALAVLGILIPDDLQRTNALKGMMSLLINAIAVVWFALFGPVRWAPAAIMAVGALAGGYFGVGLARRLGAVWLKVAVIAYSVLVAAVLLIR
jgi:uncharacterized protein